MRKGLLAAALMLAVSFSLQAQREYPCFHLPGAPALDGKLDDAAWRGIPEATGFFLNGKTEFAVRRQTHFKAGWTSDGLYLAIRCAEPTPGKIKADKADGGNLWEDDDLELFLLPPGQTAAMQLVVNAKGSRWNGVNGKGEPPWTWKAAAAVGAKEWRAELEIPWATLRGTPTVGAAWKFSVARTVAADATGAERASNWPQLTKGFDDVQNFAALVFKGAPPPTGEVGDMERRMNDPALSLQLVLQGKLRDVAPLYQEFGRRYGKFRDLAGPQLQREAAEFGKAMDAMEKAAESKAPELKAVEAALAKTDLADRLAKATANCCVKVSLATVGAGAGPWQEDGKHRLWCDPLGGAPTAEPLKLVFNCDEKTFAGKSSVKLEYGWTTKGGRILLRAAAPLGKSANWEPHLGLWVHGNGSGDKLYDTPIDWTGWRYLDVKLYTIPYPEYIMILNHDGDTLPRQPLYFGATALWYDAGVAAKTALEAPEPPYPFPFYLANDEVLCFGLNNGLYDVEIGLDAQITDNNVPELYVNECLAKGDDAVVRCQCAVKDGSLRVRALCGERRFSGVRHVKLSRKDQTVAYCDATTLNQDRLETNSALFERELGGKQLAVAPRIVYQFELAPGEYTVRLRFNRWRGTYPGDARFDVFLQGAKVMETRGPNKELLTKDFSVKSADGHLQVALLGVVPEAYAWLGDISVLQGGKMVGFVQPRPSIPESVSGDYAGLRNLAPNPSFETEAWQRNWASISPASKPARTDAAAHHGSWSLCLEPTTGPSGLVFNVFDSRRPAGSPSCTGALLRKIREGKLATVSQDERFEGVHCVGAPIDYTRPYRFSGWVKTERASDQAYLQLVWIASPRPTLAEKPLIPESPKLRRVEHYFSILGVSESAKLGGSRDWRQLVVEAKPPYGASHAQLVLRADGNQGKVYFDDLDFDGFGANPVEIVLPQAGYHPNGEKVAFVKTREPVEDGEFHLDDANGKTVYSGSLEPIGSDAWGIALSRADFSEWRGEGKYALKATAKGLPGAATPFFAISANLYRDLGMLSINGYFHIERCGTEIPGWHPACHLDMSAIRNDYRCGQQPEYLDKGKPKGAILKHVDLTGGWHDAGSLDKYGTLMSPAVIQLCRFWEDTHFVSKDLKEKYPDVLSEANWGIDYVMRSIVKQDNKIYDSPIEWNPVAKDYICLGSDPTDDIKNTADDPVCCEAVDLKTERNNPKAVRPVALTRFANNLREHDEARAKELLETAALWNADGNFALALARYLSNGKKEGDLDKIEAMAEKAISSYRAARYPCFLASLNTESGDFPLLFDYVELCPDAKSADDFKALVRRICDEILKPLSESNAYGVVDQVGEPVMTRAFSRNPDMNNPLTAVTPWKYLEIAYFLVRAGALLDDPELTRLGERHVQYVLGRNPQGLCMVGGAGWKVCSITTLLFPYGAEWLKRKGQIPGSVGSLCGISDGSNKNFIMSLGPMDFPVPQTASELTSTFACSGEVYEVPTGWFVAVCGALDRALRENHRHGRFWLW